MFGSYFELGFNHILDRYAYDHVMFIVAICVIYRYVQWKEILILVTAFTIGHSLTLALSTMGIIDINPNFIEMLIPITIIISAAINLLNQTANNTSQKIQYTLALVFGFIHGLGFSNYLKSLLGKEESILGPLFAFNVGVEVGQIIIVALTVLLSFLLVDLAKLPRKIFNSTILISIILFSIKLLFF